jgi:ribonucleotide monophosphatase NagD (HAD superfamily)
MENTPVDKNITIQMRLRPKTVERINNLSVLTGTSNKTQLIANSIELAEELIKNTKEGAKIYIVKKDGTKELLKILGI